MWLKHLRKLRTVLPVKSQCTAIWIWRGLYIKRCIIDSLDNRTKHHVIPYEIKWNIISRSCLPDDRILPLWLSSHLCQWGRSLPHNAESGQRCQRNKRFVYYIFLSCYKCDFYFQEVIRFTAFLVASLTAPRSLPPLGQSVSVCDLTLNSFVRFFISGFWGFNRLSVENSTIHQFLFIYLLFFSASGCSCST